MNPIISSFLILSIVGVITLTSSVDIHQAKCTITEGAGIKVDSCDASQFLSCQSGRCMCNDIGNQLYDYHLVPEKNNSRSKRGLKKKIAAGVAGGAVGYVAAKAVSKSVSGSGSSRQSSKLTKVYSCYGRVGSMCQLDYNNVNVVTLAPTTTTTTTTTSTTTEVPNTTIPGGSDLANVTSSTTTAATTTTSTTPAPTVIDVTKLPKCVRHAVCTRSNKGTPSIGGHVVKTDVDPRIGTCACEPGYKVTTTDRCEKSGSAQIISSLPVFMSIFYALVISKFF